MISDQDKRLCEACELPGPRATRALCCRHRLENFRVKLSRSLGPLFWKIARARTVSSFEQVMTALKAIKPEAEDWQWTIVSLSLFF